MKARKRVPFPSPYCRHREGYGEREDAPMNGRAKTEKEITVNIFKM